MSKFISLSVGKLPSQNLAFSNRVYIHKNVFDCLAGLNPMKINQADPVIHLLIRNFVFMASVTDGVDEGNIAMNSLQRESANCTLSLSVPVSVFSKFSEIGLESITVTTDVFVKKAGVKYVLDCKELSSSFKHQFSGQVFAIGQQLAMDFEGTKLDLMIEGFEHDALDLVGKGLPTAPVGGQVLSGTNIVWKKRTGSQTAIKFTGTESTTAHETSSNDLDEQFMNMFRTVFASRFYPPGMVKQLGINHIRGILLYGPPDCGQMLIARQIGKALNAREAKIISGPELLDKFVCDPAEKIRALFADAEKEQMEYGDTSTGVSDSIVNQLLSKIDGVDPLNNILIIGMTNRKEMIDEAVLRPGRLEIQIEVTVSEDDRKQIFKLNMKTAGGVELEGLVHNAASFARGS